MAHALFKKIFEPFMTQRCICTHNCAKVDPRSSLPRITKFEAKRPRCLMSFPAPKGKNSIAYALEIKKATAVPLETQFLLSFFKKESSPLDKISGYQPSAVKPGLYFPSNWRWFAETCDPPEKKISDCRSIRSGPSADSLRVSNERRLKNLKKLLNEKSMLKGSRPHGHKCGDNCP